MMVPVNGGVHAYEMHLTPQDIKEIFARNKASGFVNRKISKLSLSYYKHMMLKGKWRLSNDAVCITKDGELINGQTRLTAALETGLTLPFLVMLDADKSMFPIMDTGKKRNPSDFLRSIGGVFKNTKHISSAVSFLLSMLYSNNIPFSSHDRVEVSRDYELVQAGYEKHASLVDTATTYYVNYPSPKLMSCMACISCYVIFSYVDALKAANFFNVLNSKKWGNSDIFPTLYNALNRIPNSTLYYYKNNIQVQMLITAWNCFVTGKEKRKIGYIKPDLGHVDLPLIEGFDRDAFLDGIEVS